MSLPRKIIAVVDDDPAMLKAVERLLRLHGFDTAVFASAEAFLGREAPRKAACLVLDIHLGGMSGLELRRRLAASGCRAPIIFITGVDDDALCREAMDAGCAAYLRKPFPASQLIGAIAAATA